MKLFQKKTLLVPLVFLSLALSIFAALRIGELFFFDKLFYGKSVVFGYFPAGKDTPLESFGKRSQDIVQLLDSEAQSVSASTETRVLGASTGEYVVAVIGDSFVWGTGIKEDQRVSVLLEKKLNRYRKTKVISLAQIGDSALDNYLKYQDISRTRHIDAYIFVLIENDLMLNLKARYLPDQYSTIIHQCVSKIGGNAVYYDYEMELHDPGYYERSVSDSFKNSVNLCVLNYVAVGYPKNGIYFSATDYDDSEPEFAVYNSALQKNGLRTVSSAEGKKLPEYKKYWSDPWRFFAVSKSEQHSSALANQMYADILTNELLTNPQFSFLEK